MDREKLSKAAYAETDTGNPYEQFDTWYVRESFKHGAKWLMQQPLSERLTEEEREKIRELYKSEVNSMELENSRIIKSKNPIDKLSHEANWWMAQSKANMLERIFGADLFK